KYGDAVIWFQLLDIATSTKKPVVFVTRDTKEDWWLQHNGETIGPRPELIQEMQKMAGVRFYMYAMPRFLEFAQQFFGMRPEPTKKATTEIKEIEQQEKYTAEWVSGTWSEGTWSEPLQYSITPVTYNVSYGAAGLSPSGHAGQSGSFPTFSTVSKEEEEASRKYFQLLPVNGQ